jgi:hypothetical protein
VQEYNSPSCHRRARLHVGHFFSIAKTSYTSSGAAEALDAEAAFLVFPVIIGPTDRSSSMGVDQLAFSESITIYI